MIEKNNKYKPFRQVEKRGNNRYVYERTPYYDPISKNTKYGKKKYLGKFMGRNENGELIIQRVRDRNSDKRSKADARIEAVLTEKSAFKAAVKDLSKKELGNLIGLLSFLLGKCDNSDLETGPNNPIALFEKITPLEIEKAKVKPREKLYVLYKEYYLKAEAKIRNSSMREIFKEGVDFKTQSLHIKKTAFLPYSGGVLYPPYDSITGLTQNNPFYEKNLVRVLDVRESSQNLIENSLLNNLKVVIIFHAADTQKMRDLGIQIETSNLNKNKEMTTIRNRWGDWKVFYPSKEMRGYAYNFGAISADIKEVVFTKQIIDVITCRVLERMKTPLLQGDFNRSPKESIEKNLNFLTFLGYVIENIM